MRTFSTQQVHKVIILPATKRGKQVTDTFPLIQDPDSDYSVSGSVSLLGSNSFVPGTNLSMIQTDIDQGGELYGAVEDIRSAASVVAYRSSDTRVLSPVREVRMTLNSMNSSLWERRPRSAQSSTIKPSSKRSGGAGSKDPLALLSKITEAEKMLVDIDSCYSSVSDKLDYYESLHAIYRNSTIFIYSPS